MQWTSAPNIGQAPLPQRARGYWKAWPNAAFEAVERVLEAERAQLPPWAVVGLMTGIAAWVALPLRSQWLAFLTVAVALALLGFLVLPGRSGRAIGWFSAMGALGCALVWGRSERVAAPRLDRPAVVRAVARIEQVEVLSARDSVRLTLAPEGSGLPPRVRVTVATKDAPARLSSGSRVALRVRLAPPPPMALPGTYDFARDAWFRGIGAVGRALGPVSLISPGESGGLDGTREALRRHILSRVSGSPGGIAIALVTGDQNGVSDDDADAMRRSGLTHLLSVSGLHIAAVVGFAMFLSLRLLALFPAIALRVNLVLVAAAIAAAAGIGYTALTGMQVPTVRSCVAALLVLAGIALGRDALSLRLIAVGALLVLLFRPEALAGASFQMSFAAVTAIVALHSTTFARRWFGRGDEGLAMRAGRAIAGMIATGIVVELALAPLALFHFHRTGLYGVAANIIAIPLTTFVIMPLEALALIADPVGLGAPLWWGVDHSIRVLLGLARWVAAAKGAVAVLPSMPVWAFAAMVSGGLWICLWRGRLRHWGWGVVAAGAAGAALQPAPALLITGDGRHVAIRGKDGVPVVLRQRTGDYVRGVFGEALGFDGDLETIDERSYGRCSKDSCVAQIPGEGRQWRLLATRSGQFLEWRSFIAACSQADIIVSDRRLPDACRSRWLKLDRPTLQKTGGMSIILGDRPVLRTVNERVGQHPWQSAVPSQ